MKLAFRNWVCFKDPYLTIQLYHSSDGRLLYSDAETSYGCISQLGQTALWASGLDGCKFLRFPVFEVLIRLTLRWCAIDELQVKKHEVVQCLSIDAHLSQTSATAFLSFRGPEHWRRLSADNQEAKPSLILDIKSKRFQMCFNMY